MLPINDITDAIIAESIRIHRHIGPGAFESAYEELLCVQLKKRGILVDRQVVLPFEFEGTRVELGYRIDLLVDKRIIVEVKSTERPALVHHRQLLTYLRLSGVQVGLLINFGMDQLRQGISRVVNNSDGERVTPTGTTTRRSPPLRPSAKAGPDPDPACINTRPRRSSYCT